MFTNILKGDPMAKQKIDKNYLDFIYFLIGSCVPSTLIQFSGSII